MFLFLLIIRPLSALYRAAQRWLPTNRLTRALRTRRGLRWGIPAIALGLVYLWAAAILVEVIAAGGPGWLHLAVLVGVWNFFKLTAHGLRATLALIATRLREATALRRHRRAQAESEPGGPMLGGAVR